MRQHDPPIGDADWQTEIVLKSDLFSRVEKGRARGFPDALVRRDLRGTQWWVRPLAIALMRRERRALRALGGSCPQVPRLVDGGPAGTLLRSWLPGEVMYRAPPTDRRYYADALRLLARLHRRGIAHNDLAKEPNWLVGPGGEPLLVDFQLATVHRRRGRLFRLLAREDIRHLLKHKRKYCAAHLTARQTRILASPSLPARLWRATGKQVYLFVTRRLLGWADREGAGDRGHRNPA
jgi:hypothetical protein